MSDMQPTMSLRFVAREYFAPVNGLYGHYEERRIQHILQQGWASSYGGQIEWRDVPLVPFPDSAEKQTFTCVCGNPNAIGVQHHTDGPCYVLSAGEQALSGASALTVSAKHET